MGRNDRFRIYGARMKRFGHRFFIFIGLLALFSLATGASSYGEDRRIIGILLVLGLSAGTVILWLTGRRQRELDRSHQLAAETVLLFPDTDAAAQDHAYTLRKRREKRLEALFYLILAALAGLWFWAMYAIEADEASWMIGGTVIVPGLLLIALVLLILSVLPLRKDEEMPGLTRKDMELALSMLSTSDVQNDDEPIQTVRALSLEEECTTAEEYLQRERLQLRSDSILFKVGMGFFVILPLVLFVCSLIVAGQGGPKWFVLYTGILVLGSTALWIFMTHAPGGMGSSFSASKRRRQLNSTQFLVIRDTILSHRMGGGAAEIEFARSGKVRVPCRSNNEYTKYFCVPRHAAIVSIYKGRIQSIALLRDEDEDAAASARVLPKEDEASDVDIGILMSDEALHEAALQEIRRMPPSRRLEMETEIEQMFRDMNMGSSYSDMTTLEQGEWHQAASNDLQRSTPDITLAAVESHVMEQLNVPRSAILEMKKNPFAPSLRRRLLIAALVGVGGALLTGIIEKAAGTHLGFGYLLVSILTGGIAMNCAEDASNMRKFRKLQKAYQDPKYRRKVLDAAVYREIREQVKQKRHDIGLM